MPGTHAESLSLATRFSSRHNSLNAIRLILAATVIVSHSWPLGGYGHDPQIGDQNLGAWAVAGFFTISGYLITASRQNSRSLVDFATKRFLRIVPGFIVVLVVTAFAFAPLSALLTGQTYRWSGGVSYVFHNIGLVITQPGIPGTLSDVPFPLRWNGALWTIVFEVLCYIAIAVLVSIVPKRLLSGTLLVLFLLGTTATTMHLVFDLGNDGHYLIRGVRLMTFFLAGALLYTARHRIPLTGLLAAGAAALLAASMFLGVFQIVAGLPMAYLMMYLAVRLPLSRIGSRNDVSYGLYIYGFPVQQLLSTALIGIAIPLPVYLGIVLAITIPLAWASWLLIERPSLRLARRLVNRGRHESRPTRAAVNPSEASAPEALPLTVTSRSTSTL